MSYKIEYIHTYIHTALCQKNKLRISTLDMFNDVFT